MSQAQPPGAVTTLGFGTAVAMWELGYLGRLPFVQAPGALLFAAFVLCFLLGGFLTGRWLADGVRAALKVGALAALIDFLVLGSVVGDLLKRGEINPGEALGGALVFVLLGAGLAALGALAGRALGEPRSPVVSWSGTMGLVTLAATFLIISVGGLVTSNEAGLAVVDWPGTQGSLMFLYPLSQMTGGVYYEHAHRLFGSLVGLTTVTLGFQVWRREERRWLRQLTFLVVLLVCAQGVLGGMRVTGKPTLAMDRAHTAPSLALAVVHGAVAQVFFALVGVVAAALTHTWRTAPDPQPSPHGAADRQLTSSLVGMVCVQLLLGAVVRHYHVGVVWHLTMAVLVLVVGIATGARCWGLYHDRPWLPRLGLALMIMLVCQLCLGVGALATSEYGDPHNPLSVPLATAHQTLGAVILVTVVQVRVWHQRLVLPEPEQEQEQEQPRQAPEGEQAQA